MFRVLILRSHIRRQVITLLRNSRMLHLAVLLTYLHWLLLTAKHLKLMMLFTCILRIVHGFDWKLHKLLWNFKFCDWVNSPAHNIAWTPARFSMFLVAGRQRKFTTTSQFAGGASISGLRTEKGSCGRFFGNYCICGIVEGIKHEIHIFFGCVFEGTSINMFVVFINCNLDSTLGHIGRSSTPLLLILLVLLSQRMLTLLLCLSSNPSRLCFSKTSSLGYIWASRLVLSIIARCVGLRSLFSPSLLIVVSSKVVLRIVVRARLFFAVLASLSSSVHSNSLLPARGSRIGKLFRGGVVSALFSRS